MATPRLVLLLTAVVLFATERGAQAQPVDPSPLPPIVEPSPPPIVPASPPSLLSAPVADRDAARAAFRRGFELMLAERWQDAIDAFERSYAALPTELALIDEAICLERLLRNDEAMAKLREFQERFGRVSTERRASVERAITRLASRNPSVAVRTSVPGATIRIDGHDVGRTPLIEPMSLRSGAHSIEATHPGHITVVRHVMLSPGERREVVLDLGRTRAAPRTVASR